MELGKTLSPKQAMCLALQEAKRGLGWVEPNPPVGCVILDSDYRLLSSGHHEKYGENHAEVCALKKIKNKKLLKGAHVFITLEPCHHQGKTPPCSLALANYSIHSLTYGEEDFFTEKKGLNYLREKGVNIFQNLDYKKELKDLIAPFRFTILNRKPFVSLKVASSLDGIIALENGESRWITGENSREHAHFLRAQHAAVLIGVNTLLKDNPRLNIRVDPFKKKKNKVIILDPEGKSFSFLSESDLLKAHPPERIIVCCSDQVRKKSFSSEIKVAAFPLKKEKYFSLSSLLQFLYQEEEIYSVLVEGGAFCWSQFLKQKAVQKLYLYVAPKIIGSGLRWSKGFTIQKLSESGVLNSMAFQPMGDDFLIEGMFLHSGI